MKKVIILSSLILFVLFNTLLYLSVYAATSEKDIIGNKIDNENKQMNDTYKKIESNINKGSNYTSIMGELKTEKAIAGPQSNETTSEYIIRQTINYRKQIVWSYMLYLIFSIALIVIFGAKNLSLRKRYIIFSVVLTVMFILLLNAPVLALLYDQSSTINISYGQITYTIFDFMRNNSIAFCFLLFFYGKVNILLGDDDYPKRKLGNYLVNSSIGVFIVLQTLPNIIKFVV